ncbi:MAG TPA: hypothetical protein PK760_02285 [Flavobacteriales bacterium]|nr:hypothetical protein [Flavobacteriales bacterium]
MKRTITLFCLLIAFLPASLFAVSVSVSVNNSHCGLANGAVFANASGGLPPYTYSWDNGGTGTYIGGLLPGSYTVTVTDGLSNTAQATGIVMNDPNLATPNSVEQRGDCGGCSGWAGIYENDLSGTAPYTYDWPYPPTDLWGTMTFLGVCAWSPSVVNVTDANGCPGSFTLYASPISMGYPEVVATSPACGSSANGSVTIGGFSFGPATFNVVPTGYFGPGDIYDIMNAPYTITGLPIGTYDVYYWNPNGNLPFEQPGPVYCTGPTTFTIDSLTSPCGSVSGTVYHDADQDCAFNGFDLKEPYRVITIAPVNEYAITDGNGHYAQNVNYGSLDLSQTLPALETQTCPPSSPVAVTVDNGTPNVVQDFANLSSVPHDISVHLWSSAARPGFPTQVWATVSNWTAFPSGNVSLDITYDPLLQNPNPAIAHWDLGVMAPYTHAQRIVHADVPADIALLGTVINYTATVTDGATESSLSNNIASLDVTITGSYDPNDKQGNTSSRLSDAQYFLQQDAWIDYTVRFQNTGTAAATTVVIRDVLDTDLDITSLEILGASHAFTPSFGQGRELIFTFNNINLPDSAADLLGSQGFVSFRIKPNNDIAVGDLLENTAGIYFDINPPIITNTTSHVVDFSTGVKEHAQTQIQIAPNPASELLNVILPKGASSYEVLALDGRRVQVPGTRRADGFQLDVRSLQAGTYLLRAGDSIARFVKQ